jgi:hypothetical protein
MRRTTISEFDAALPDVGLLELAQPAAIISASAVNPTIINPLLFIHAPSVYPLAVPASCG